MKKIILFLCVAVMAFSLAACGGSSAKPTASPAPTPASTATPAPMPAPTPMPTPEISEYDKTKQAILDHIDVAYTGLTPSRAPMYFLASNDGAYAALVMENADGERYIKFIGSATVDENGITTVTDSETGYMFGFTAEALGNGSFFLDCGNLGECYLQPVDPGNVVDNLFKTFNTMANATEDLMDSLAYLSILDYVDYAYTGLTAIGAPMHFLLSDDGSYAALVLEGADGAGYIKFVGSAAIDEAGIMTVTDSNTGYSLGFSAEAQEDGSFFLDCGNLGECYLEPDEPETVLDYILTAFQEKTDVTEQLVKEIG